MSDSTPRQDQPLVDPVELATRVKAKRNSDGLSARAAAKLLGMSAATISRVESGEHLPERDHLFRLADWAGVPLGASARKVATTSCMGTTPAPSKPWSYTFALTRTWILRTLTYSCSSSGRPTTE